MIITNKQCSNSNIHVAEPWGKIIDMDYTNSNDPVIDVD